MIMASKPSVLIIDPDAFLAGIYARKFESDGWKVYVAESIPEGQKIIQKRKVSATVLEPEIDLIQSQVFMEELRQDPATVNLPIVVLSTLFDKKEIERMKRAGASAYLIKGHFVPTEAVRKVRGLLIKERG